MGGVVSLVLFLVFSLSLVAGNAFIAIVCAFLLLLGAQNELSALRDRIRQLEKKTGFKPDKPPLWEESEEDPNEERWEMEEMRPIPQAARACAKEEELCKEEPVVAEEFSEPAPEPIWEDRKASVAPVKHKPVKPVVHQDPYDWEGFFFRKFLPIFGVLSLVLGIGFFIGWAIKNDYLNEIGRIALGILFSLGLVGGGELMRKKYSDFYPLITGAGIAGLLVVTYLARSMYSMMGPELSFIYCLLEVTLGVVLALRYNSQGLVLFSFLGALTVPFLTDGNIEYPIGMLAYLSLLTVGGFYISLYRRWGSLLGLLLAGTLCFEVFLFSHGAILQTPEIFLAFIFGLHALIGSGGIVRALREKLTVTYPLKESQNKESFEIALFCLSLLSANILAYILFQTVGWVHFGYWLLLQALVFVGLGAGFLKAGLSFYQKIFFITASGFLLLGTFLEMQSVESWFLISILFLIEGSLLSFVGRQKKEFIFTFFGQLAIWLSFFFIWNIETLWQSAVAIIALMLAFLFTLPEKDSPASNLWVGLSLGATSLHLCYFLWYQLLGALPVDMKWLAAAILLVWGVGICLSSLRSQRIVTHTFGALILGGLSFVILLIFGGIGLRFGQQDGIGLFASVVGLTGFVTWYYRQKLTFLDTGEKALPVGFFWGLATIVTLFFAERYVHGMAQQIVFVLVALGALLRHGLRHKWKGLVDLFGMGTLFGIGFFGTSVVSDMNQWTAILAILYVAFGGWMFWESRPREGEHIIFTHGGLLFLSIWMFQILFHWVGQEPLSIILWSLFGAGLSVLDTSLLKRPEFRLWGWAVAAFGAAWYAYWLLGLASPKLFLLPATTGLIFVSLVLGGISTSFRSDTSDTSPYPLLTGLSLAIGSALFYIFGTQIFPDAWTIGIMVAWGAALGTVPFFWKDKIYPLWGWGVQVFAAYLFWIFLGDPSVSMGLGSLVFAGAHLGLIYNTLMLFSDGSTVSEGTKKLATVGSLLVGAFSAFVFGALLLQDPGRTVFWMLYGIVMLMVGLRKDWHYFLRTGTVILSGVIAKLYLNDLWEWETWMRFVAFFILGLGILFISFYFQKRRK